MRLSKARKECVTAMMRDTIFEAAGSVLANHGTKGLTMDRVANVAGLTAGSLYTYFSNKNDLLHFLYDRLVEPFLQAIEELAGRDMPASQKLATILNIALEHAMQHRGVIQLLANTNYGEGIKKNARPRLLRIITQIFEQGIADGDFRPHETSHSARMYLGCLAELFELQATGAPEEDVKRFAATLVDATLNGFSIHVNKASVNT